MPVIWLARNDRLASARALSRAISNLCVLLAWANLLIHLGTVIGYMKRHTNYADFEKELNIIAPIYPELPGLFDDPKDREVPK
jgi:hypothetical protein